MLDLNARFATASESEGMLEIIRANDEAVTHMKGACALWWQTADMITVFDEVEDKYLFVVVPQEFLSYFKGPRCGSGILRHLVDKGRVEKETLDVIMVIVDRRKEVQLTELARYAPMSVDDLRKIVAEDPGKLIASEVLDYRQKSYYKVILLAFQGSPVAQYLLQLFGPEGFADAEGPGAKFFDVRRN